MSNTHDIAVTQFVMVLFQSDELSLQYLTSSDSIDCGGHHFQQLWFFSKMAPPQTSTFFSILEIHAHSHDSSTCNTPKTV